MNKTELEESDITKSTKKALRKATENDITVKNWTRNCPKCKKELIYKRQRTYRSAVKNNGVCWQCSMSGKMLGNTNGKGNLGKKHSEEDIKKQRERMIGNFNSKGKPKPESWKVKMSEKYKGSGNPFYGKAHTEEFKNRQRENFKLFIEKNGRSAGKPRYNQGACVYFNQLNEVMGWNGQHAQRGGEKQIGKYFVDFYEPGENIVVEYDEPSHEKPSIKEKDIIRQNYIIKELNCKFYRYSEKNDTLYEVFYQ